MEDLKGRKWRIVTTGSKTHVEVVCRNMSKNDNVDAQKRIVEELANEAHEKPGSPHEDDAKERRVDAEKELTSASPKG
jgi:hypothetical protein